MKHLKMSEGANSRAVCLLFAWLVGGGLSQTAAVAEHSVARQWDEEILDGIRVDLPRPPVHARNLFHAEA